MVLCSVQSGRGSLAAAGSEGSAKCSGTTSFRHIDDSDLEVASGDMATEFVQSSKSIPVLVNHAQARTWCGTTRPRRVCQALKAGQLSCSLWHALVWHQVLKCAEEWQLLGNLQQTQRLAPGLRVEREAAPASGPSSKARLPSSSRMSTYAFNSASAETGLMV